MNMTYLKSVGVDYAILYYAGCCLATSLCLQMFEQWIQDIAQDKVTLDRIKLCICGHPRVGKSAMRQSLSRPYLQVIKLCAYNCGTCSLVPRLLG